MNAHILLVDDDQELTFLLKEYLEIQGLQVSVANNGKSGLKEVQTGRYDLMILDIMMPEMDGLTVLKNLSTQKTIPIIMLTAKGDDMDCILGLELGADDYISKPCNPRELLARINAVLRRNQTTTSHMQFEDNIFSIHPGTRECKINGQDVELTSTEFDLLYILLKNKGVPVSKNTFSFEVLGRDFNPMDRSIDVHIFRLRKKLHEFGVDNIKTIRGKGYQLSL